ncbi:hypothetical protein PAXRUDRAFT_175333, partial [Paxillus rubicundulus Ve08.2h10]
TSTDLNEYQLNTHPLIIKLTDTHLYLPLILFTIEASKCLYNENWKKKCTKEMHCISKTPIIVLNLTTCPDETSLTPITWLEASVCYVSFLRICTHERIATHFNKHFFGLSCHEDFKANFPAILGADIEYRENYNAQLCEHDTSTFTNHLTRIELKKTNGKNCSSNDCSSCHHEPYKHPTFNLKFKPTYSSCDTDNVLDHLCLICTHPNDKISSCHKETLAKGGQILLQYVDKKLILHSNQSNLYLQHQFPQVHLKTRACQPTSLLLV